MAKIVKIKIGDKELDAIEQSFEIAKENWNEYHLLDGGVVRVKTTVQKLFRILDESGDAARSPDGDPMIYVRHTTQVTSSD